MKVFEISKGRFAIGTIGKLATYVVQAKGKKVTGVRGRRPRLEKGRYTLVTAPAAVAEAFKAL
jgi:hypothetical protein